MFNYPHLKERDREKIAFAKREKQSFRSKCIAHIILQQRKYHGVGSTLSCSLQSGSTKEILSSLLDVIVRRLFILRLLPAKITKHLHHDKLHINHCASFFIYIVYSLDHKRQMIMNTSCRTVFNSINIHLHYTSYPLECWCVFKTS